MVHIVIQATALIRATLYTYKKICHNFKSMSLSHCDLSINNWNAKRVWVILMCVDNKMIKWILPLRYHQAFLFHNISHCPAHSVSKINITYVMPPSCFDLCTILLIFLAMTNVFMSTSMIIIIMETHDLPSRIGSQVLQVLG